jgi:hypothetical protein
MSKNSIAACGRGMVENNDGAANKRGMIELYKLPNTSVPFPREYCGTFASPFNLRDEGFSESEITDLLNGKCVQNHVVDFAPAFMEQLAVDELIREHGGRLTAGEIAEELESSQKYVEITIERAIKKMRRHAGIREVLKSLAEINDRHNGPRKYSIAVKFEQ